MSNTIKITSTLQAAHKIKQNLEDQIRCITNQPEIFAQTPPDFSRNRKISFETTLKIILS
ncbi:IS4 family transposase, partial [Enterococcus faecalis]